MPKAELVFANVLDGRTWERDGDAGLPVVYALGLPGRALKLVVIRYWKAPQGVITEQFQFVAPSGRISYESPRLARRMPGQMDLTQVTDVVEDAIFEEQGIYAASFLIDGEIQGQAEFQLLLGAPGGIPKDVEDAIKKSDVMWVGIEEKGRQHAVPVWFAYRDGRIYLIHTDERDAGEQQIPGLPDATDLLVVTRRKGRDTRAGRFHASVRIVEPDSPEFDGLAGLLADRRRDRHGPPQEAVTKWKSSCVIAELTPAVA